MTRRTLITLLCMAGMALLSLAQLFGVPIAGLAVIIGLTFFFVAKQVGKQPAQESGLDFKTVGAGLRIPRIWLWILLPVLMNLAAILLSKILVKDYAAHVLDRSKDMLSLDNLQALVFQLMVLALGEEIAWRAFFQKQMKTFVPLVPALLITSCFFSVGHLSDGSVAVVLYDLVFVFVNSLLYGVVFEKTNNAWISAFSHFLANAAGVLMLFFM